MGHKVVELWVNSGDGQLSQSRFGIFCMVAMMMLIDAVTVYLMLTGGMQPSWMAPICGMNSATVGSLALAYYGSNRNRGGNGDIDTYTYAPEGPPVRGHRRPLRPVEEGGVHQGYGQGGTGQLPGELRAGTGG